LEKFNNSFYEYKSYWLSFERCNFTLIKNFFDLFSNILFYFYIKKMENGGNETVDSGFGINKDNEKQIDTIIED